MYVIVTSQVITERYMDLTHEMHFMYKFYTMSFLVGMSCKSCHYRVFSVLLHVVRLYVYSLKVKVHILQVVYMHLLPHSIHSICTLCTFLRVLRVVYIHYRVTTLCVCICMCVCPICSVLCGMYVCVIEWFILLTVFMTPYTYIYVQCYTYRVKTSASHLYTYVLHTIRITGILPNTDIVCICTVYNMLAHLIHGMGLWVG